MEKKICKKCNIDKYLSEYNKDKYSSDGLRYRCKDCTREDYRNYYDNNVSNEIERQTNYQKNNKIEVKKRRNVRVKKKYDNDSIYKIKILLRNRMKIFFKTKNVNINKKIFQIVGCTPEELKKHIENQFKEDMSWENHDYYGWHIDHIIPLSSAKTEEEINKLCHFTNLQPLWATENYKKGKKIL
jgi:hypothetical protein